MEQEKQPPKSEMSPFLRVNTVAFLFPQTVSTRKEICVFPIRVTQLKNVLEHILHSRDCARQWDTGNKNSFLLPWRSVCYQRSEVCNAEAMPCVFQDFTQTSSQCPVHRKHSVTCCIHLTLIDMRVAAAHLADPYIC